METFLVIVAVLFVVILYFMPSIIAEGRIHPNLASLFILNLFLGWTVIGWVGAFAWAYSKREKVLAEIKSPPQTDKVVQDAATIKKCPFCAEEVRVEAIKCKHCGSDLSKAEMPQVMRSGRE